VSSEGIELSGADLGNSLTAHSGAKSLAATGYGRESSLRKSVEPCADKAGLMRHRARGGGQQVVRAAGEHRHLKSEEHHDDDRSN
jgi:hypothetical protein